MTQSGAVSYLLSADWLSNGTAPGSRITGGGASGDNLGSPCCWFMHEPCAQFLETDGGDINGGDIQTGRHPCLQQAGDGGGLTKPSDILDAC